jgi:hypothetical protein
MGKNSPIFVESSQSRRQAKKYIKAQLKSPKHQLQTTFETLKYPEYTV